MKRQYIVPCLRIIQLDTENIIASSVVDQQETIEPEVVDKPDDHPIWGDSDFWGK